MINRLITLALEEALATFPVVALLGGRQVGKTTLARSLVQDQGATLYLDLERPSDAAKLEAAELYLEMHTDKLVILDEVQRVPEIFPLLRSLVDADRRPGRFLVLGSASRDLLRQSSESLAGRIRFLELGPLCIGELPATQDAMWKLWMRGGFPPSYLAGTEPQSAQWREAFVQTYLERDLPGLGVRVPAHTMHRFWRMVAHSHGQVWNASKVAGAMGVSAPTAKHYLDLLKDTFIVRHLPPYFTNLKKRLVKSPKVYLRDSGILHSLLQVEALDDLFGNPIAGSSWEGWVIEQLLALSPPNWRPYFYRTSTGSEIDLLLERPGKKPPLAFEIKFSASPTLSSGFHSALRDLDLNQGFVVCPCKESFPLGESVATVPAHSLQSFLAQTVH